VKIGLSAGQERELSSQQMRQKSKLDDIIRSTPPLINLRQPTDSSQRPLSGDNTADEIPSKNCQSIAARVPPLVDTSHRPNRMILRPLERGERALSNGGLHPARIRPGAEISPDKYLRAT